jgi:23S rRNA pseudouridine2604 synthase
MTPDTTELTYPIRLNVYLARQGYSTRRGADDLIRTGKVMVNGAVASLGQKVYERDAIVVQGVRAKGSYTYLAYNKPKGVVTHGAQENEEEIRDRIKKINSALEIFPVGRLDKRSTGLILLTDDGRIVGPLLSPDSEHEKEYRVTVNERLRKDFATDMEQGVDIGGYTTKPCIVKKTGPHTFTIRLTEGKNHQIKRMCSALGYTVNELARTRIMHIRLGGLRPGTYRHLKGPELQELFSALGISD